MADTILRPRKTPPGQGDACMATSAFALSEYLSHDPPRAGRVLTICADDMAQWVAGQVNDQPLWLVDGSGTVKERGPCSAASSTMTVGDCYRPTRQPSCLVVDSLVRGKQSGSIVGAINRTGKWKSALPRLRNYASHGPWTSTELVY